MQTYCDLNFYKKTLTKNREIYCKSYVYYYIIEN